VAVKERSLHRGGEPRGCGVDLRRGAEDAKVSQPGLYVRRRSSGGRQAAMARMSVGVLIKQLVVHLWTLCQNAESFLVMWTVGTKASAP